MRNFWEKATLSADELISGIAAKAVKESTYHTRHCAEWVIRLGDGTEESQSRMIEAIERLSPIGVSFLMMMRFSLSLLMQRSSLSVIYAFSMA